MGTIIIIAVILAIYFIPSLVAGKSRYATGIFILNLFLGWTILGWIGALIWAVSVPKEDKKTYEPYSKKDYKPYTKPVDMTSDEALTELKKDKDKLDLGLITQEKYDSLKIVLSKYINDTPAEAGTIIIDNYKKLNLPKPEEGKYNYVDKSGTVRKNYPPETAEKFGWKIIK